MPEEMKSKAANPVTEESFRKTYGYEEIRELPLWKRIAKSLRCTRETALNLFPVARWLPEYSVKKDLLSDFVAGTTVAIMHIPHGLSYAPLGYVDPIVGLYMAVFPVFVYAFMGTSRQISLGTFAIVCAMVGEIVSGYDYVRTDSIGGNWTAETVNGTVRYTAIEIGTAVCFMVGLWQFLLGLLRLGILLVVMSDPLISGFTTGAAFYVFSYQLKHLFGLTLPKTSGILKLFHLYWNFFARIKSTNLVTLGISTGAVAILLVFNEFVKPLIGKRFPKNKIPIPIELFVIVLGILISHFGKLSERYQVRTVKEIPDGFPRPKIPPFSIMPSLVVESFVVAIVALAVNLSLAKMFSRKGGYHLSDNQELIAYGASNLFASFFFCLPAAASLSRSSLQFQTGGKTQLTSLFSIVLITFVILFAGFLFEPVPYCVLSSVVVVTLRGLLFQVLDLPKIWRKSRWDGISWLGTFSAVIVLDIDVGLAVGIGLSILVLICTSLILQVNVAGRVPGTNLFLDLKRYKSASPVPRILILQVVGQVNFANCNKLERKITREIQLFSIYSIEDESHVVLDLGSTTRIDPATVDTFKQLDKNVAKGNSKLYLAACNAKVYEILDGCDFFRDFPKERILASVSDAVAQLTDTS